MVLPALKTNISSVAGACVSSLIQVVVSRASSWRARGEIGRWGVWSLYSASTTASSSTLRPGCGSTSILPSPDSHPSREKSLPSMTSAVHSFLSLPPLSTARVVVGESPELELDAPQSKNKVTHQTHAHIRLPTPNQTSSPALLHPPSRTMSLCLRPHQESSPDRPPAAPYHRNHPTHRPTACTIMPIPTARTRTRTRTRARISFPTTPPVHPIFIAHAHVYVLVTPGQSGTICPFARTSPGQACMLACKPRTPRPRRCTDVCQTGVLERQSPGCGIGGDCFIAPSQVNSAKRDVGCDTESSTSTRSGMR
jgi:hypothetical protein